MANRGLRIGDVLRLEKSKIKEALRTGKLTYFAKGDKLIRISTNRIEKYLKLFDLSKSWTYVYELISRSKSEEPQRSSTISLQRALKRVAEELGWDSTTVYSHLLRRSYALAFLRASNNDVNALKIHMSWSSIDMASKYVDFIKESELDDIADRI